MKVKKPPKIFKAKKNTIIEPQIGFTKSRYVAKVMESETWNTVIFVYRNFSNVSSIVKL